MPLGSLARAVPDVELLNSTRHYPSPKRFIPWPLDIGFRNASLSFDGGGVARKV